MASERTDDQTPVGGPVPFEAVLASELSAVRWRREAMWAANAGRPDPPAAPVGGPPRDLAAARAAALDERLVGLAFSGGGIRSGTFALGFLQGLARLRLLRAVDYLSTVSGGGYAGAWLAAWVYREGLGKAERAAAGLPAGPAGGPLANVELQLDPGRVSEAEAVRVAAAAGPDRPLDGEVDDEPEPVRHLRAYSNYLTPRPGWVSADTWTLVAIYLRNTLINLLILVPALLAVVLAAHLVTQAFGRGGPSDRAAFWEAAFTLLFFLGGAAALVAAGWSRAALRLAGGHSPDGGTGPSGRRAGFAQTRLKLVYRLLVVVVAGVAGVGAWVFTKDPVEAWGGYRARLAVTDGAAAGAPAAEAAARADALQAAGLRHWGYEWLNAALEPVTGSGSKAAAAKFGVTFAALAVLVGLLAVGFHLALVGRRGWWLALASPVLTAGLTGLLCFLALRFVLWPLVWYPAAVAALGPPLFLLAFALTGFLEAALLSRGQSEFEREWRSRLAAALALVVVGWLVLFGAVFFLPGAVAWLARQGLGYVTSAAVAGWVGTTAAGVLAGRSRRTGEGAKDRSPALELVAAVGPPVFLVGLVGLLGVAADRLLGALAAAAGAAPDTPLGGWQAYSAASGPAGVDVNQVSLTLTAMGGCGLVAAAFSGLTDVNVFSLHALYANRLTRCYLGASRRKPPPAGGGRGRWGGAGGAPTGAGEGVRREDPVTGFDPADDIPLAALRTDGGAGDARYHGPYPLFNTALNLVAGAELAVQDRKAAAFVLSPGYCGGEPTGWAATPAGDADRWNLTLGRAMTISGAAVDPNMGVHQSAPLTALLTVFNARLGWWLGNPARAAGRWAAAAPRGGMLQQLGREFLGLTDEAGAQVHLSDGGHFDNSGVYELVRRRVRFVVAVDAAEDRADASENLANVIRLVRADFGIRIEIDTSPIRKGPDGLSRWRVAVGAIRYDDVDARALAGTLVFVRAALTGDEPPDVRQYANAHPEFPHTPTADQFFDNAQFESYRALGEHTAVRVLEEARANAGFDASQLVERDSHRAAVRGLFAAVRNLWFPPPPAHGERYSEAGRDRAGLLAQVRSDPRLAGLARALYPEVGRRAAAPAAEEAVDRLGQLPELLAVNQMLDVMERAWLGLGLVGYHAHPMHRGWMNAFRRWSGADTFQRVWPVVRGEYSKEFVRFCEQALNLPAVRAKPVRVEGQASAFGPGQGLYDRVAALEAEFLREWGPELAQAALGRWPASPPGAADRPLTGAVWRALQDAEEAGPGGAAPLVWLLHLARPLAHAGMEVIPELEDYPVGVLAVAGRPGRDGEYEVAFWLRGPYRSLGLGRSAIEFREAAEGPPLYEVARAAVARRTPGRAARLTARYPGRNTTVGDRLQRALWINFFHDYDFRRVRTDPKDPFVVVEYEVPTVPG